MKQKGGAFRIFGPKKRSRAILIQIAAVAALFAFVTYIANNTISNLELLGIDTGYGFLWEPANYDINQRLIDYDSRSPHIRATVVGILNTLLVSVTGIIMATVIGFVAGVLRLSRKLAGEQAGLLLRGRGPQRAPAAADPPVVRHHRPLPAKTEGGPWHP